MQRYLILDPATDPLEINQLVGTLNARDVWGRGPRGWFLASARVEKECEDFDGQDVIFLDVLPVPPGQRVRKTIVEADWGMIQHSEELEEGEAPNPSAFGAGG